MTLRVRHASKTFYFFFHFVYRIPENGSLMIMSMWLMTFFLNRINMQRKISYIFVQIAEEGFCLIKKSDGTFAPDVGGRERLHLPRQKEFPVFQLVTLLPI